MGSRNKQIHADWGATEKASVVIYPSPVMNSFVVCIDMESVLSYLAGGRQTTGRDLNLVRRGDRLSAMTINNFVAI